MASNAPASGVAQSPHGEPFVLPRAGVPDPISDERALLTLQLVQESQSAVGQRCARVPVDQCQSRAQTRAAVPASAKVPLQCGSCALATTAHEPHSGGMSTVPWPNGVVARKSHDEHDGIFANAFPFLPCGRQEATTLVPHPPPTLQALRATRISTRWVSNPEAIVCVVRGCGDKPRRPLVKTPNQAEPAREVADGNPKPHGAATLEHPP